MMDSSTCLVIPLPQYRSPLRVEQHAHVGGPRTTYCIAQSLIAPHKLAIALAPDPSPSLNARLNAPCPDPLLVRAARRVGPR